MFLVTVDTYSKWLEVQVVNAVTFHVIIEHLQTLFTTHRIPEVDKDTQFTRCTEFL